jgi:plastocyanin
MRLHLLAGRAAVTLVVSSLLVACVGDDTSVGDAGSASDASLRDGTAPVDASGDASAPTDAGVDGARDASLDAGGARDASDAAPAVDPCATDGGDAAFTTYTFEWSFAVSSTALNGGKGQVITVKRCDSVRWHNPEAASHSVVSSQAPFDTGTILFGATSASIQMKKAGVFPYVCGIHGSVMSGELTVQ